MPDVGVGAFAVPVGHNHRNASAHSRSRHLHQDKREQEPETSSDALSVPEFAQIPLADTYAKVCQLMDRFFPQWASDVEDLTNNLEKWSLSGWALHKEEIMKHPQASSQSPSSRLQKHSRNHHPEVAIIIIYITIALIISIIIIVIRS